MACGSCLRAHTVSRAVSRAVAPLQVLSEARDGERRILGTVQITTSTGAGPTGKKICRVHLKAEARGQSYSFFCAEQPEQWQVSTARLCTPRKLFGNGYSKGVATYIFMYVVAHCVLAAARVRCRWTAPVDPGRRRIHRCVSGTLR